MTLTTPIFNKIIGAKLPIKNKVNNSRYRNKNARTTNSCQTPKMQNYETLTGSFSYRHFLFLLKKTKFANNLAKEIRYE